MAELDRILRPENPPPAVEEAPDHDAHVRTYARVLWDRARDQVTLAAWLRTHRPAH